MLGPEDLEGDAAAQGIVEAFVDFPHGTLAKQSRDPELADVFGRWRHPVEADAITADRLGLRNAAHEAVRRGAPKRSGAGFAGFLGRSSGCAVGAACDDPPRRVEAGRSVGPQPR